jgi:cysteine protease ATG4
MSQSSDSAHNHHHHRDGIEDTKDGIWLIGTYYGPIVETEGRWGQLSQFQKHLHSRLWITYRQGFEPIRPSEKTSDTGWGCMLRTGQMILAEALVRHYLGLDWRLGYNKKQVVLQYAKIISWFFDRPSSESPFSIHRVAVLGKEYGKQIGEWFGPATICSVLQRLVNEQNFPDFTVYVASDGVVYKDQLSECCCGEVSTKELTEKKNEDREGWKSVLILIPLRLGLDCVNTIYESSLKETFKFPQSVGIAGGRPNASLYFIGLEGNSLIYLDPHSTRPIIEFKSIESYVEQDLESYHCSEIKKIDISRIDPSLLVGFYCKTKSDLVDFIDRATRTQGKASIFSIGNSAPVYNDAIDIDIDHIDDDGDD